MNLRQVRKKTKSVKNVKKITKAMQMVSAVKMRKAQQIEIENQPYREALWNMIVRVSARLRDYDHELLSSAKNARAKNLVIVVSSDKGLCGAFNSALCKHVANCDDPTTHDIIAVGKKGAHILTSLRFNVVADYSHSYPLTQVGAIFDFILEKFLSGEYKTILLAYNKFISPTKSTITIEPVLPLQLSIDQSSTRSTHETQEQSYVFEPSASMILHELLKSEVEDKIRGALLSSEAVEHAARMMAMKQATDNANEVAYNLMLTGNKIRQAKITNELLDMVTAKESVEAG